jgi:hypothetical protein
MIQSIKELYLLIIFFIYHYGKFKIDGNTFQIENSQKKFKY